MTFEGDKVWFHMWKAKWKPSKSSHDDEWKRSFFWAMDNVGSYNVHWTCLCSSCLSNYVDINNGHSVYIWVQLDMTL